jgi:phospholipase C
VNNVDEQNPSDVLCNASAGPLPGCSNTGFQKYCDLKSVSLVTPVGDNSDHPGNSSGGGGPDWVASIVDAIGHSTCADAGGSSYWNDTAIVITWDDWGGWPDHVQPTFLLPPKGDYQYGFRVPLLFVSAYTYNPGSVCGTALIDNNNYDFGSIARFIEGNFLGAASEGALGFADFRAANDLSAFYPNSTACPFMQVPHHKGAQWFLKHKPSSAPPDND